MRVKKINAGVKSYAMKLQRILYRNLTANTEIIIPENIKRTQSTKILEGMLGFQYIN